MRLVKQQNQLPINNIDDILKTVPDKRKHGSLLPSSVRCLIVGPSNCGKTNVMISLLTAKNGLVFKAIYVYSKSLNQLKYQYLKQIFQPMKEIDYYTFTNNDDVCNPLEAKCDSIFIFDDVVCDKQNNICKYFSMGRHKNIDCFYLCQTYSKIPKQLVRDNSNLIVLFKQDERNLQHVYADHVNTDMTYQEFKNICNICWKDDKYGTLVIDKESEIKNGRYRKGFDCYIYM
jgi:hypothetical protein